jgi:hypothetical protein
VLALPPARADTVPPSATDMPSGPTLRASQIGPVPPQGAARQA